MAAYWHILLPYSITYSDDAIMEEAFQEKFGEQDYDFVGISEYDFDSPPLPNGQKLTFHRREKVYQMKQELLISEWKPFCIWVWEEFRKMYKDEKEWDFHSSLFDDDRYSKFVEAFEKMNFSGIDKKYKEKVDGLKDNYFLSFDHLPSRAVYEGWPLPSEKSSVMGMATLFQGYEKMNVLTAETVAFWNFAKHVRTHAEKKFKLGKYILVMGF